jgi:hypothetical protein
MKKVLLSAMLGLAAVTLTPPPSHAGTFGLITGCGSCGCCGGCNFCVRPYNAFTPVCCGNITCMGCMPFTPYPNYSGLGYPGGCPQLDFSGAVDNSCSPSDTGGKTQSPTALPPVPAVQQSTQPPVAPPMPQSPAVSSPTPTSMTPYPYGTIQAGYRPMAMPTYNPYLYYNNYGAPVTQIPYYWNSK